MAIIQNQPLGSLGDQRFCPCFLLWYPLLLGHTHLLAHILQGLVQPACFPALRSGYRTSAFPGYAVGEILSFEFLSIVLRLGEVLAVDPYNLPGLATVVTPGHSVEIMSGIKMIVVYVKKGRFMAMHVFLMIFVGKPFNNGGLPN